MTRSADYHHGNLHQALIARAIELISEGGVESVSLRSIARDLGVSHAAPTRHFRSKGDLLLAIAAEGVDALLQAALSHAGSTELSALGKLKALAQGYVGWAKANPAHHLLLRNRDVMRHANEQLKEKLKDYAQLQQALVAKARAEGWRSDTSERLILMQIIAMTAGLAFMVADPLYEVPLGGKPEEDEIQEVINDFFSK
ncbi:TetR/AcrR family transcriptional regulator [Ferrimonas pelagia]|uniref:HTH tetR-type domain-containing protein n=1 Tax=Ferrimonas pelagia TaxID=1177826 RepID=A0ABP9EVW3_9GAMM